MFLANQCSLAAKIIANASSVLLFEILSEKSIFGDHSENRFSSGYSEFLAMG